MAKRTKKVVVIVLISAFLIIVIVPCVYYQPRVTFEVERGLVGPDDERVWALLYNNGSVEEFKQAVLETGKHPDQMVWIGGSLLSNAVEKQREDLVVWLLEQGANPNGVHPSTAPLINAVENKDADMVRLLIQKGADPNVGNPLDYAVSNKDADMVRLLIKMGADPNLDSPLGSAILHNDADMVQLLIECGANPDLEIIEHWSPRDMAVRRGNTEVIAAIERAGTTTVPSSSGK